jgi:hypothetical protein
MLLLLMPSPCAACFGGATLGGARTAGKVTDRGSLAARDGAGMLRCEL